MTLLPPAFLVIGPFRYSVMFDEVEAESLAVTDTDTLVMTLDPKMPDSKMATILLHEILHTLTEVTGLAQEWSAAKEEEVVGRLAPALGAAIRDNPQLIKYLQEAL